jgi:acetyl-CoA carboxylase carboxyl transferase subunit alpha
MDRKERKREIDRLEHDVEALRRIAGDTASESADEEIERLHRQVMELKREFYRHLGAWQRTQLARHPQRPYTLDYIKLLFTDFSEMFGDRNFADDPAIVAGMARFQGRPVAVVGHQKGRDTKQKLARNFGMPKPEGYRKALRVMRLAAKFGRPIFSFVDTPGAYPGIDAEERGQAEAIAHNLREMARLPVPVIVTITGEGGSGGALAIAVGDRVLMLENAIYSVISPEGCASIMWRDAAKAESAAAALKITAQSLLEMGIVDQIVSEPEGGAHHDHESAAKLLEPHLVIALRDLSAQPAERLISSRYDKFRRMGDQFLR